MTSRVRIAVVTSDVPFVEGGHLTIARSTLRALREYGYEADLVLTPQNRFGRQFRAYLANRWTDVEEDGLGRRIHQVISFRFPSYAVRHPVHVCWLNHRLREYYDLWPLLLAQLGFKARCKERVRRSLIRALDTFLLKHSVTRVYSQSKTIQERLRRWGNIPSEVLYPPPPQRDYRTKAYAPFVLTVSRLESIKRTGLLVESFRHIRNRELRAVIIGSGSEERSLLEKIKEYDLETRVTLLGSADQETLLDHYARCRAVFFAPYHEDYGLVTAEAFASRKPVITTTDSGGPAEIVQDGKTGRIFPPRPEAIARGLDEIADNEDKARDWGENGHAFISRITWEGTVRKLVIR